MLVAPLLALIVLLASAAVAEATTFTVNTFSDSSDQNSCDPNTPGSTCSLRDAVADAGDGDTIQLQSGTYSVTLGTIDISHSITISGTGPDVTNVDGRGNSSQTSSGRIFKVDSGTVAFQDLSLNNGNDANDEQCCDSGTFGLNGGGALFNAGGTVSLTRTSFLNDRSLLGGAVSNKSSLTMTDVSFTNDGGGIGGGLFTSSGTVNGTNVTFENDATGATDTAAVYLLGGTVSLINSTVYGSGGASKRGGGIDNHGAALTLDFDTLANNVRGSLETDQGAGATTTVSNTIIADGFSDGDTDCVASGLPTEDGTSGSAITTDNGNNLDQDNSCGLTAAGDLPGKDPKLVPIFGNNGRVDTQALLAGSPALDAASSTDCPSNVSSDARDVPRPQGAGCDIGAFEAQVFGNPTTSLTGPAANISDTSASMTGTINLDGEAGGFHFVYGTAPDQLNTTSPEFPAGVVSTDTAESGSISGLTPGTTYYYRIVADNASGSVPDDHSPQQFTANADPPGISNVSVTPITDTTATVNFTIDPGGADSTFDVQYGLTPSYTASSPSPPGPVSGSSGATQEQVTLTNLTPNTTYHFNIEADNAQGHASRGDDVFQTSAAPQPTVSSVSPGSGPTVGGTTVTITGTNFTAQSTVKFGNTPATNVNAVPPNQITATSPGGHAGAVDVRVTTAAGTSATSQSDKFTYLAPKVTGVSPSSGPAGGGNQVTISGSNFTGAASVKFGNNTATIKSGTDTQLVVLAPAGSGTVDVTVVSRSGDTSATGSADKYTYTPVSTPPPTGRPKVAAFTPLLNGKNGAQLTGEVDPQGLATTAYYVYGLDARYQQFGITVYDQSTPKTQFGADFTNHQFPAVLTHLLPNALYHVRLVAANGAGMTVGPDVTFTTPRGSAPPPPALGHENVKPSGGTVFVVVNGKLVPLTENTRLPAGAEIDALHGSISLVGSSGTKGKAFTGTFGGAIFKLTQTTFGPNKGLITLAIVEGAFPGAPSYASCTSNTARAAGAHIALSSRVLQTLRSRSRGRFRTRGRYAAGTVRGTQWTTSDRCDGTLIAVQVHAVQVTDLVKHITLLVHAGHHYLALAHPPKTKKKHK